MMNSLSKQPGRAIKWDSHGHRKISYGYVGNRKVASISKEKNHTYSNKDIYSVMVDGNGLSKRFRYIKESREAAEMEYSKKSTA